MNKNTDALGQLEHLVLTGVVLCREDAYGIKVHEKVEELGKRSVKLPSVYITLDRLEEKGYLQSTVSNVETVNGPKRARYFKLLPSGEQVLAESTATSQRLVDSLKAALGWIFK